jgi:hypothetical protein
VQSASPRLTSCRIETFSPMRSSRFGPNFPLASPSLFYYLLIISDILAASCRMGPLASLASLGCLAPGPFLLQVYPPCLRMSASYFKVQINSQRAGCPWLAWICPFLHVCSRGRRVRESKDSRQIPVHVPAGSIPDSHFPLPIARIGGHPETVSSFEVTLPGCEGVPFAVPMRYS